MGGRGASSGVKNNHRLPNYKNAIIARNKLKNYLLNPKKSDGKNVFFNSIGYNMKKYKWMERDLRSGIANNKPYEITNRYGNTARAYNVNMPLGVNKKVIVVTGWRYDENSKKPRFITAYPAKTRAES